MATVNEKMTAIADAIRDKTGGAEALTLDDMATDIPKVYDAGKTEETRAWWDALISSTSESVFEHRFKNVDFEKIGGFNPPYVLKPIHAGYMFVSSTITKLTEKEVDFSNCASATSILQYCSKLTEATGIDLSKSYSVNYAFNTIPNIHTLDIILGENITGTPQYVFWQMPKLENLTIGGTITFSGATFQHSKLLTAKSIESAVSALSDGATGNKITFSTAAKTTYYNAHSSEYEDADEAWDALCDTKPNWTIALA